MAENLTRLGIFVFFDPQGIVDDYVVYLLQMLRPNFTRLVTVSNCELDNTARDRLAQYSDDLFVRENRGLDAAAFKECMVSFCGWEELEKYDEVALINDTYFGPIHSFGDMFAEMAGRDVDFWGMSAGYRSVDGWKKLKYGYIPDHIQTFFVAFRKNMVQSEAFRSYWNSYDDTMNDFTSVVTGHELIMTKHFQDLGFRWDIYAQTQRYRSEHIEENFNIYHFHAHTMLRDMKFPVLKRKTLSVSIPDQLSMQDLECAADAMDYIHRETDYDTRMIWDNVLRLYNVTDLYNTLHLNYVLPSVPAQKPERGQAALVLRIGNPFFAEQFCRCAMALSECVDVYLLPEDEKAAQIVSRTIPQDSGIHILKKTDQQTEMGSFVLRCKELAQRYVYLGFVHDVRNPEHEPTTVMESDVYGYLQNTANDPAYISQILNCFAQNPRLGVLGTPFPIHLHGFGSYGNEWDAWFKTAKKLAGELDLHCKLDEGKQPFMITGAFWCRTDALRDLWKTEWTADRFYCDPVTHKSKTNEALKRLLPFAAQSQRYYSGIVMHTNYASMRLTSQQVMLDQIVNATRTWGCTADFYAGYLSQLRGLGGAGASAPSAAPGLDASALGLRDLIWIFLERRTPKWFSGAIFKFHRFLKKLFRRA